MGDSFLEDLGLISTKEEKEMSYNQQRDRHVTTRRAISPPLLLISEQNENNIMQARKEHNLPVSSTPVTRIINNYNHSSKDFSRQLDQNTKKYVTKMKALQKNEKIKIKSKDLKMNNNKPQTISEISEVKLQETKLKISENKTLNIEHNRRSGSCKKNDHFLSISAKENKHSFDSSKNRSSDISNKENSNPSNSSKENVCDDLIKKKEKFLDDSKELKFKIQDKDLPLFTAIIDVIKQENDRNLRAMQQLHINSQATLIKSFLDQTDELIQELRSNKDFTMEKLIEDNKRMQKELTVLQAEKKSLQNTLEEIQVSNKRNEASKLNIN